MTNLIDDLAPLIETFKRASMNDDQFRKALEETFRKKISRWNAGKVAALIGHFPEHFIETCKSIGAFDKKALPSMLMHLFWNMPDKTQQMIKFFNLDATSGNDLNLRHDMLKYLLTAQENIADIVFNYTRLFGKNVTPLDDALSFLKLDLPPVLAETIKKLKDGGDISDEDFSTIRDMAHEQRLVGCEHMTKLPENIFN